MSRRAKRALQDEQNDILDGVRRQRGKIDVDKVLPSPDDQLARWAHVLQPAVDKGQIKIVTTQDAREWLASEALRIMEDALTKNSNDIQAVVASNDGTAGGAISALPPQLVGKVLVTGQDAALDAVQRGRRKQTMTIYKPIQPLAFSAVGSAMKLAKAKGRPKTDQQWQETFRRCSLNRWFG